MCEAADLVGDGARLIRDGLDAIVSVTIAPSCAACDETLEHPTRGPVCAACWQSIAPLPPTLFAPPTQAVACARAAGEYAGALRRVVHAFKYDGRRTLAAPLAALMRTRGGEALAGAHAVVPVPLHPSRRRLRGFNQAVDLARRLGLPVCPALRRVRRTEVQADLPATQRFANVQRAFAPTWRCRSLNGAVVVVVDDVSTTGATLEACAVALLECGVREVRALTAARAVERRP